MPKTKLETQTLEIKSLASAELMQQVVVAAREADLIERSRRIISLFRGLNGRSEDGRNETLDLFVAGDESVVVERLIRTNMVGNRARSRTELPSGVDNETDVYGMKALLAAAVLVELTDPEAFWTEIREAKHLAATVAIPNTVAQLTDGAVPPGPISAVPIYLLQVP